MVEAALEVQGISRNDRESETYLQHIRPGEYDSLIEAMTENVQCGNSAIVTAPFIREFADESWIKKIQDTCKKLGVTLTIAWVYCDEDTMRTYVRHRGAARDSAKIAVYNECKAIVDAVRTTEGNAHQALQQAVVPPDGPGMSIDGYKLGTTTIARVNSYISSFENPRMEALLKAGRAEGSAPFFENWADGTQLTMTASDKALLQWAADESRANKVAYQNRAQQFARYVETVPEPIRGLISAYPGKGAFHMLPAEASVGLQTGQKVLKGMPYVGSLITAGSEGEQSWGKAAADTGGLIAGGALGGAGASALAGAIYGAPLGPVGSLVVGTVGGIAGAIGGQAVADWLVPK